MKFGQGLFRFKPDGSELEFVRSSNNNTWGLGLSEEGIVFGSTANNNPSMYLPIPNRYYEKVRGMSPGLAEKITTSNRFYPITDKVRQVDYHGGFTAAAGHAIYTARTYPKEYWNRVAFVTEPTGHLVASFVLDKKGTSFSAKNTWKKMSPEVEPPGGGQRRRLIVAIPDQNLILMENYVNPAQKVAAVAVLEGGPEMQDSRVKQAQPLSALMPNVQLPGPG